MLRDIQQAEDEQLIAAVDASVKHTQNALRIKHGRQIGKSEAHTIPFCPDSAPEYYRTEKFKALIAPIRTPAYA